MDLCISALITFFVVMIKFLLVHWGWTLTIAAIAFFLNRIPYVLGLVASGIKLILTFLEGLLAETIIGALIFAGFGSLMLAIVWPVIALGSKANLILRIVSAPFFMIAGAFVGFIFPFPGTTILLQWLMQNRSIANIMCFFPFLIIFGTILLFQIFFGQDFCGLLNDVITSVLL